MKYDVIVVGGSFAGLSAAMQLARARRRVLVIDAGQPRNRFAAHSHGFLGQDGKAPADIMLVATEQVAAYPTVSFVKDEATNAVKTHDGFVVTTSQGETFFSAKLILTIGVRDELPTIAGMLERWGTTVLHCPYCHGYEFGDMQIGVLANHPMSTHQAMLLPDWGPTTYFTQGEFEPDTEQLEGLTRRGVHIERSPIVALLGNAPDLDAVKLADGRVVPLAAIFTAPKTHLVSPLAQQLGCEIIDGMTGPIIKVDDWKQTTVAGVFAAGDAANLMPNATIASASGVMAGSGAHASMVMAK